MTIATITKDGKELATLNKSGKWESSQPIMTAYLNSLFNPHRDTGVGVVLPFGHYAASCAAERLGAEVKYDHPIEPMLEELIS